MQQYALTVLELLGDTVIYNAPEMSTSSSSRIGKQIISKPIPIMEGFTLYPNPTSNDFTVNLTNSDVVNTILLTDLTGREIIQITSQPDQRKVQVSASNLSRGIYLCSVYNADKFVGTKKVLLIK
jgi:hypothetical protein